MIAKWEADDQSDDGFDKKRDEMKARDSSSMLKGKTD